MKKTRTSWSKALQPAIQDETTPFADDGSELRSGKADHAIFLINQPTASLLVRRVATAVRGRQNANLVSGGVSKAYRLRDRPKS